MNHCVSPYLLLVVLLASSVIRGQEMHRIGAYTTAEKKVAEVPVIDFMVKADEYLYEGVRYRYDKHIFLRTQRKPDSAFNYYWVQVLDIHQKGDPVRYNFYVNPKSWAVKYLDPETNKLLTIQEWDEKIREQHEKAKK